MQKDCDESNTSAGCLLRRLRNILLESSEYWPDEEDLGLAALALARIQHVYRLDVDIQYQYIFLKKMVNLRGKLNTFKVADLAQGVVGGRESGVKLQADDCHYMAQERMSAKRLLFNRAGGPEFAVAIEWLEVGYKSLQNSPKTKFCLFHPNLLFC